MAIDLKAEFDNKKVDAFFKQLNNSRDAIKNAKKAYAQSVGGKVLAEITHHFEFEEGPGGRWPEWSRAYTIQRAEDGKLGNLLLQDSGRLKKGVKAGNYRKVSDGIEWYNNAKTKSGFPYAYAHDEGGPKLPKRSFMWLSNKSLDLISKITLAFMVRGKI